MEREDLIERSTEFLNEFYKEEILSAVNEGKKSVEVDFSILDKFDVELADYLLENPEEAISAMEEAIKQIDTGLSEAKIRLRFYNLPESRNIRIRNIRSEHIGKLIVVDGIVKRASEVRPEVSEAIFQCPECGKNISIIQTERFVRPPLECECGNRKGFKLVDQKLYDARWIMVEEPYEIVTGEKPSEMMIYLKEDLTSPKMQNKTDPGNRIRVVGILKEIPRRVKGSRSRQMDIFIDANHVESVEAVWEELEITPEDEKRIVEAAKDPEVFNKLTASIAPSMYGLEDVKEAIILQLFGADPKLLKDKTRIRGNIHILLVGDPSSGKSQLMQLVSKLMPRGKYVSGSGVSAAGICTVYDTLVQFEDGTLKKIGEVVEEEFSKGFEKVEEGVYRTIAREERKIISFNPETLKFEPRKVTHYWRIKAPSRLVKIKTRMGKEIITTLETPIPTIKDGKMRWVKAKDVRPSSFIVSPRIINVCLTAESLYSKIDRNAHILNAKTFIPKLVESIKERSTIREFCKDCGLNENDLYYSWKRKGSPTVLEIEKIARWLGIAPEEVLPAKLSLSQYNGHRITLPLYPTEGLMYVMGLLAGDGSISRTNFGGFDIKLFNIHNQILKDFCLLCNEVLGVQPPYSKDRNGVPYYRFHSKIFGNLLDKFGVPSGDKSHNIRISETLSKLPNNLLAYYLRGIFDTDGSCMEGKGKRGSRIEFSSASKEFVEGLQILLHRFGIISKIREKRPHESFIQGRKVKSGRNYVLEISGRENLEAFKRYIGFGLTEKAEKLERIVKSSTTHTNIDIIPEIGCLLRKLREELKLSAKEFYGYKCYHYEKGRISPTRKFIARIIQKFGRIKTNTLEELEKILDSEVFWDKIVEVEIFDNKKYKYVYDLTVEGEHSFVANGLVIHNTATVVRDEEFLGGWVLEAGALVMANRSICCIDEFSKVSPQDRVALQEAMSLETISIAKASIVATLPAQTAILAGGNPKLGRFDPYIPIREQVDIDDVLLSVDWSEPILIKENGLVRMETIGSFVDKYGAFNNLVNLNGNVEVPALNLKTLKIEWWPIKYVFRHKINKPLIKLLLETGREIKVTKGHSVYVFENGEIKTKKTDEIKVGDFVLIPRRLPNNEKIVKEINLVEELLKIPESHTSTIYLHNVPKDSFIRLNIKNKKWINEAILPLKFANKLNKEEIRHCYLKYKGGVPSKVPTIIPVNEDLMRLLGYYVAEGSMLITRSKEHLISFSLNRKEENIVEDLKNIVKKLFNHDVTYVKGRNEIKVNIANKIVYLLFSEILKVKKLAENKEVPSLVFNVSKELQKEFLKAYHLGDYGITVSKNLASDLLYLFLQNDIISSVSYTKPHEQIFPDGHISKTKTSYTIADAVKRFRNFESTKWFSWLPLETVKDFLRPVFQSKYKSYGENRKYRFLTKNWWNKVFLRKSRVKLLERMELLKNSYTADEFTRLVYPKNKLKDFRTKREWTRAYLNKMVKKGLAKKEKIGGVFRYSLSERGKEILRKIDVIQKIFSSDIAFVKVKKIEEASPTNEYVYDVSTPGHENFVAGFGGVICHNSRFDLKFALRDLPNPELDSKIAEHILRMRQYEEEAKPLFEPGFIRKWIAYARARVHPTLTPEAGNRLKEFYLDMRLKAGEEAPVAITLRQYEALLRLAEASARVRLSDKIELEDAERAIRLMKVSLRQFGFEPETGAIDIDRAEGARVTSAQRSKIRIMLDVIEELGKTFGKEIPTDEIIRRAKEQNVDDAEEILRKMQYEGIVYSPRTGFISKV